MTPLITHGLVFGVGLYLAWYAWPMPPAWATKIKVKIESWARN